MNAFPDPPLDLPPHATKFYSEFREMLTSLAPANLDESSSRVEFEAEGLTLTLVHAAKPEWAIWAEIGERDGIVGAGTAHEHFGLGGHHDDQTWTAEAVNLIAELLRGDIEIETTYRGDDVIAIRHAFAGGSRLGQTYPLTLARLKVWQPKLTR